MSKYSSNTFVLSVSEEKTLCEDLKDLGYEFDEAAWKNYGEALARKRDKLQSEDFHSGPAFQSEGWKLANRKNRANICQVTYHSRTTCVRVNTVGNGGSAGITFQNVYTSRTERLVRSSKRRQQTVEIPRIDDLYCIETKYPLALELDHFPDVSLHADQLTGERAIIEMP